MLLCCTYFNLREIASVYEISQELQTGPRTHFAPLLLRLIYRHYTWNRRGL